MKALEELAPAPPHTSRSIWTLIGVETFCLLGSEISRFGVSVWLLEQTQSVSVFSLLMLANLVPGMIASPFAGSVVDRSSRKRVMIGAAIVSLCGSLIVLAGAATGVIAPIFIGATLASIAESFQWPALSATIPLMASEDDLPRYNGFLESGRAASMLAGPAIGGFLFALVGLPGLVSIELATFALATFVVAGMSIPKPDAAPEPEEDYSLLADAAFGFRWIVQHRPMFKFLLVATFANFWISIAIVVMAPYGLSFLSEREYGITNGLFGAGMILGGIVYGVASKRFTNAQQFLWTALILGVVYVAYGFSRDMVTLGGLNILIATMMTIGNGAIMTIWQTRVPDELQGRVLSAMRLVADITAPVAFVLAGPISDKLVPALYGERARALWGGSETAQMGALFSVMGVVLFAGFAIALTIRDVRRVEDVAL